MKAIKQAAFVLAVSAALSPALAEPRLPCERDPSMCGRERAQVEARTGCSMGVSLGTSTASEPLPPERTDDPRPRPKPKTVNIRMEMNHSPGREPVEFPAPAKEDEGTEEKFVEDGVE